MSSTIWLGKWNPEDSASLYETYPYATKVPHGHLVLDLSQDTDDLLRYRTNIFLKQYPTVIYPPVSDEPDKVQLSHSTSV
jgi:hypothetical protein